MESLGQYLKKLREERGFALEDVAEETKLREKYLRALEQDRFEALPAEVYAKLFLKLYAQFLKIDKKELYSRYESQRTPAQRKAVPTTPERKLLRARWLPLGGILVLVLVAVVLLSTSREKRGQSQPPTIAEETETLPDTTVRSENQIQPPVAETIREGVRTIPTRGTAEIPASTAENRGGMLLKVQASDSSWLEVIADDDTLFYGFILKGDEEEFEAAERFILTAGKPEEVQFFLNGDLLRLPFSPSRTIYKFELKRSQAARYTETQKDTAREGD
jgi:cytoskeleton protein RodZ